MKFCNLLFVFIFFISMISGYNGSLQAQNNPALLSKEKYIESIDHLSYEDRKKQLEEDAIYLESLLDSIAGVRVFFSLGSRSRETDFDTVEKFTLPSPDVLLSEFSELQTVKAT